MKRIIEVDENLICEGFVRNFTEKEKDVLINAIRYSTPYEETPKGELVSREWLEDAFDNLCCHNCKICRNFRNEDSFYKCNLIDNAPKVKFSLMPADERKEEAYMRGYEKGKIRGFLKANTRPTGEWIKVKEDRMSIDMSGEIVTAYKCSKCGRMIAILPSKLADYPFCHCGAAMRKEDKE